MRSHSPGLGPLPLRRGASHEVSHPDAVAPGHGLGARLGRGLRATGGPRFSGPACVTTGRWRGSAGVQGPGGTSRVWRRQGLASVLEGYETPGFVAGDEPRLPVTSWSRVPPKAPWGAVAGLSGSKPVLYRVTGRTRPRPGPRSPGPALVPAPVLGPGPRPGSCPSFRSSALSPARTCALV